MPPSRIGGSPRRWRWPLSRTKSPKPEAPAPAPLALAAGQLAGGAMSAGALTKSMVIVFAGAHWRARRRVWRRGAKRVCRRRGRRRAPRAVEFFTATASKALAGLSLGRRSRSRRW